MEEPSMHIAKLKNPVWKGYILNDILEKENCGGSKKISGCQGLRGREEGRNN